MAGRKRHRKKSAKDGAHIKCYSSASMSAATASVSEEPGMVKFWEGRLLDGRKDKTLVTRLEGYVNATDARLVSMWPTSLTLLCCGNEVQKKYGKMLLLGERRVLMFRPKEKHAFFQELYSTGECAVIGISSQMLLLYPSNEDCSRLNGLLIKGPFIAWLSPMPYSMPCSMPPSMPCSMPPSMPCSMPPSMSYSLSPSMSYSMHPSMSCSMPYPMSWMPTQGSTQPQLDQQAEGTIQLIRPHTHPGLNYNPYETLPMPQLPSASSVLSEATPVWTGALYGMGLAGKPIEYSRLEGYAYVTTTKDVVGLVADWPSEMHVACTLTAECKGRLNMAKVDYFIFKPKIRHLFFQALWSSLRFAAIQLPSQLLLLYVSDESCWQLNGMLFSKRSACKGSTITGTCSMPDMSTQENQQSQQVHQSNGTCQHMKPQLSCQKFMSLEEMFMPRLPYMSLLSAAQRVWTGTFLGGPSAENPILLAEFEGTTLGTTCENIAADWPDKMYIECLVPLFDMNWLNAKKVYYLLFRRKTREIHTIFKDMWFKQLWGVIKLPSHTMFLCVAGPWLHWRGVAIPDAGNLWLDELGKGMKVQTPQQDNIPQTHQEQPSQP